ncbi:hypothetical protein HHX48_11965 [Salinimonas sp. HHU 13199]|uniref:Acetyltransferase n=1 Tax=Salinimonas profundi TaxID=2729140 RepID=A0ABR8LJS7_9ALTE|nr:hypothetical protein [Salinimonas profundi]MBD3586454.1 hypothetical protein [Salinimonas profundi]
MHHNQSDAVAQPERRHGDIQYFMATSHNQQIVDKHRRLQQEITQSGEQKRSSVFRRLFTEPAAFFVEPDFFCESPELVRVGEGSFFNHNCALLGYQNIVIGKGAFIGPNVIISSGPVAGYTSSPGPVVIEDSAWIGANSLLLPHTHVGNAAIIGANSVVNQHVAAASRFYNAPVFRPDDSSHS